jgi:hypothetical protein
MAEFCLDCFNDLNGTDYSNKEVWLANDFCEGCGKWKPCVLDLKPNPFWFIQSILYKIGNKKEGRG